MWPRCGRLVAGAARPVPGAAIRASAGSVDAGSARGPLHPCSAHNPERARRGLPLSSAHQPGAKAAGARTRTAADEHADARAARAGIGGAALLRLARQSAGSRLLPASGLHRDLSRGPRHLRDGSAPDRPRVSNRGGLHRLPCGPRTNFTARITAVRRSVRRDPQNPKVSELQRLGAAQRVTSQGSGARHVQAANLPVEVPDLGRVGAEGGGQQRADGLSLLSASSGWPSAASIWAMTKLLRCLYANRICDLVL